MNEWSGAAGIEPTSTVLKTAILTAELSPYCMERCGRVELLLIQAEGFAVPERDHLACTPHLVHDSRPCDGPYNPMWTPGVIVPLRIRCIHLQIVPRGEVGLSNIVGCSLC